jgi:hypothetical protein
MRSAARGVRSWWGAGAEGSLAGEEVVQSLRGGVVSDGHGVEFGDCGAVRADGEVDLAEAAGVVGEPLERLRETARKRERGERRGAYEAGAERGDQYRIPSPPRQSARGWLAEGRPMTTTEPATIASDVARRSATLILIRAPAGVAQSVRAVES